MQNIKTSFNINGELFDLSTPKVMGILNLTPDSFYDGGKNVSKEFYLPVVEKMISEGADIIDIGAFSSRPGADLVSEEEELQRLIKPLKDIRKQFSSIPISIDTYRSNVAEQVVCEGGNIINDITAGEGDTKMFGKISELRVPYVMMHKKGHPKTMQTEPTYKNVVADIVKYLSKNVSKLKALGVNDIIVDPGFGFGKTVEHNYQLLKSLKLFRQLNLPILIGLSRKSMINKVLEIEPDQALNGTSILHTISLLNGANLLRVHDVKEAKEAIKLVSLYKETDL